MTEETARTVANLTLGAAAAGAAYLVLRDSRARGMAWRLVKIAMTTALPGYLVREVREAWAASAPSQVRNRPA